MTSEVKTPKELADAVREAIPGVHPFEGTKLAWLAHKEGLKALAELERMAHRLMILPLGFTFIPSYPLPPAESCAHAVERFREALLLLTKRHEVEIEIGHIEPGSRGGGIEQLPDQDEAAAEIDATYRAEFDVAIRERKAWDAIEAWIDRAPEGEARDAAFRKSRHPRSARDRVLIISERSGLLEDERQGVSGNRWRHKTVRRDARVEALEAAALWCEGQK